MTDDGALPDAGFRIVELLDASQLDVLAAAWRRLDVEVDGFCASSNDLDRTTALAVHAELRSVLDPALDRVVPGCRTFLTSFLAKGDDGRVAFHQDLSYTDERTHRALVAWVPLCDVDERNGCLWVVPGSHLATRGSRPSGCAHLATEEHQEAFAARAVPVRCRAGTAVVYDPALVHGSGSNTSGVPRVAVGAARAPIGAPLVHVHHLGDGDHRAFAVDEDYHLRQGLRSCPDGYPQVPLWREVVRSQDFTDLLEGTSAAL